MEEEAHSSEIETRTQEVEKEDEPSLGNRGHRDQGQERGP